jgi:hypothetical protein
MSAPIEKKSPLKDYFFSENQTNSSQMLHRHMANMRKMLDSLRSYKKQKPFLSLLDALEYFETIKKYQLPLEVSHIF